MITPEMQKILDHVRSEYSGCPDQPIYPVREAEECMLPMPDSIRLRTIIYRPDTDEAVPTIVVRTCYPFSDFVNRVHAEEYCKRGFAYIFQYCRGTGGSEGEWEPHVNERADGKFTLDWIAAQDWVKNIGYTGCSYLSQTGWLIADIVPDKVKTMYLTHYGVYRHTSAYQDGLFRHDILTAWSMWNAGRPVNANYLDSCRYRPHIGVAEALWGGSLPWYEEWISAPDRSDPYWEKGVWKQLKDIPSRVKIPLYVGEGWYDHHLGSCIQTWESLPAETRAKSRFLIGAWDHGFHIALEDRTDGKQFEENDTLRQYYWFRDILKEERMPKPGVEMYLIGDDRWLHRRQLDTAGKEERRLYLTSGSGDTFGLAVKNGDAEGCITWNYDPENPVYTHGAESLLATGKDQGSLRQQLPGQRDDVISCISEPLEEDMAIIGKIRAHLTVSADVDDTAFAFKVMEVFPNGNAYNIRTGITTLGYRNQSDARQTYKPYSKVQITIDTWQIAWKLHKGSRIRVDLTSSDFPQYSLHSNYAGPWALQDKTRTANLKVYFGGAEESYISFPV